MRRLTALEALSRGASNVRANVELVAVSAAGSILILVLMFLCFLPWLTTLGIDPAWFAEGKPDPEKVGEFLRSWGTGAELLSKLGGLVLSLSVALTLASIVYCWYQGGVLGVLVAGDAQAPAGTGREAVLFRTWSRAFFLYEARRLTWRLFWFYSLFMSFWTLVLALVLGILLAAGLVGQGANAGAGCLVGCGLLIPSLFVGFMLVAAMMIGQIDLVRPESGVMPATRAGFSILGRRLGAAVALFAVFVVVNIGFGIAFGAVGLVGGLLLAGHLVAEIVFRAIFFVLETGLGAAVGLVLGASFAALVRSETASPSSA